MRTPTPEHVIHSQLGGIFYEPKEGAEALLEMGCSFSHMEWATYCWPGGYPLFYVTRDGGCLCPSYANENMNLTLDKDYDQWCIVAQVINYEDNDLSCDNCYADIPAAYGDDEEQEP